jgi:hypothetical protein
MKHRETYFSKLAKTDDEIVLGVVVPPIVEFSHYAVATLQAIETDEVSFDILLSLLEAFDSVFEFPSHINKTPLFAEIQNEIIQQSNLNEVIQLDDDVIISKDDISTVSALTSASGSVSTGIKKIGGDEHYEKIGGDEDYERNNFEEILSGRNSNTKSSLSLSQQIGGRHNGNQMTLSIYCMNERMYVTYVCIYVCM